MKEKVYAQELYHCMLRRFVKILARYHNMKRQFKIDNQNVYSKEPKSVTAFNLFTFFRTDLIQSEGSWKLSSSSDCLMPA